VLRRAWNSTPLWAQVLIVLLGTVLVVTLVALILKWAPEWLATKHLKSKDEAEEVGRVRTALLATLAGILAIVTLIFTGLSYRLNQSGQITERFTRAVDQLGSKEIDVRLGGIYALERIARDSSSDHPQVVEVLTAYVREHAPWDPDAAQPSVPQTGTDIGTWFSGTPHAQDRRDGATEDGKLRTDVQAAMTVLGRRVASQDRATRLDLVRTDLRRAYLRGANLEGADLDRANLQRAYLLGAKLQGAYLLTTNLKDAFYDTATTWPTNFHPEAHGAVAIPQTLVEGLP
jgi:hypothetical protein